ncbi:MAG: SRPBCC domain-containing protein [Bacteroidota bacterium]
MQPKESKTVDREIRLSRLFHAPIELVWEVWTDPEHIRNWWGPNGFTTTIHGMNMNVEGEWNLTMHGPDGTDYKNKSVFKEIIPQKKIVYEHVSAPKFLATILFEERGETTFIDWHMLFETEEAFIHTVKTFKADEGLKQNADRLSFYIQSQQQLRKQLKTTTGARVSTYLNFPGNTEEAILFYKKIFGTEFARGGIQRFGDIKPTEGAPAIAESDKKLILHVELPILGGHVLMATDAPESMGFTVNYGNNVHISLEPETREETKRLYEALSAGGTVTMELQDMFWGSYYGSFTDKYGVNWMVNCYGK